MDKSPGTPNTDLRSCQVYGMVRDSDPLNKRDKSQLPFKKRVKLFLKRVIGQRIIRSTKKTLYLVFPWLWNRPPNLIKKEISQPSMSIPLKPGEIIRVRSADEIKNTLNYTNELKRCAFMPEMYQYCGTTQRVFKSVRRFVDERDYKVKKSRGIVLLEGVNCEGTEFYGPCDRACYFFWREEWLERIEQEPVNN